MSEFYVLRLKLKGKHEPEFFFCVDSGQVWTWVFGGATLPSFPPMIFSGVLQLHMQVVRSFILPVTAEAAGNPQLSSHELQVICHIV